MKTKDLVLCAMFVALIAVGAFIKVPVPVVPFTLQFLFTMLAGLLLVGLGCAPIYPSIIHATPGRFGADRSQAIIGVQMASAYIGNCLMPPLFGAIANHTTIAIFPYYLLVILILMGYMHEALQKKTKAAQ